MRSLAFGVLDDCVLPFCLLLPVLLLHTTTICNTYLLLVLVIFIVLLVLVLVLFFLFFLLRCGLFTPKIGCAFLNWASGRSNMSFCVRMVCG